MRNEDKDFADIIKQEFDEHWDPTPPPREPEPPTPGPQPDFHLSLYDDDEDYRTVGHGARHLSHMTLLGAGLIGVGVLITVGRILGLGLPSWTGWIAVACFLAGVGLWIGHLVQSGRHDDEDDDGVV